MALTDNILLGYDPAGQVGSGVLEDQTGNLRDATFVNSPTLTANGIEFDRLDLDKATVGPVNLGNLSSFHARLRFDDTEFGAVFGLYSNNANHLGFWYDGVLRAGSWNSFGSISGGSVTIGQYYNVAITHEFITTTTAKVRLYLNGAFVAERLNSQWNFDAPPTLLVIGCDRTGDFRSTIHFDGTVASFAVWDRILTNEEITALDADHLAWNSSGPAADEVPGGTVTSGAPVVTGGAIGQTHSLPGGTVTGGAAVIAGGAIGQVHSLPGATVTAGTPGVTGGAIGQVHLFPGGTVTSGSPVVTGGAIAAPGTDSLPGATVTSAAPQIIGGTIAQVHSILGGTVASGAPQITGGAIGQVHLFPSATVTAGAPVVTGGAIAGPAPDSLPGGAVTAGAPSVMGGAIGQVHRLPGATVTSGTPVITGGALPLGPVIAIGAVIYATAIRGPKVVKATATLGPEIINATVRRDR